MRKVAIVAGVLYLITEVTAIGGLALYGPVLGGAEYVGGSGTDNRVLLGALAEILLVFAIIGSGVVLYPVVKRQNESVALGYLSIRLFEAMVILVGIMSYLTVVTLRQNAAGGASTDPASLATIADSLIVLRDWTFLFGPGFLLGVNSVLLAYLMYRSRLVPRLIAGLGLAGGSLIVASTVAVMFGLYGQFSNLGLLVALPVFAWEVSLALYLIVKGFASPVPSLVPPSATPLPAPA